MNFLSHDQNYKIVSKFLVKKNYKRIQFRSFVPRFITKKEKKFNEEVNFLFPFEYIWALLNDQIVLLFDEAFLNCASF